MGMRLGATRSIVRPKGSVLCRLIATQGMGGRVWRRGCGEERVGGLHAGCCVMGRRGTGLWRVRVWLLCVAPVERVMGYVGEELPTRIVV